MVLSVQTLRSLLNHLFSKDKTASDLSEILARLPNKEELLGMKEVRLPSPRQIRDDAAAIVGHTSSVGYKKWADNVWGRIVTSLDKILDERSSQEVVNYHRAAVKTMLDLLRDSYEARSVVDQYDKEQNASLQHKQQGISRS